MHDLVLLHCEREFLVWKQDAEGLQKLEAKVRIGLYHKKSLDAFWHSVKVLIVEKLSREVLTTHARLMETQVKSWIEGDLPEMEPGNLEISTLSRIPNVYHLLETKSSLENHLEELVYQPNSDYETKEKLMKCVNDISDLLWNPKFWVNSDQLLADYKLFTGSVNIPNNCIVLFFKLHEEKDGIEHGFTVCRSLHVH